MLTKTEVHKALDEARAKATDEQNRLNSEAKFSEAIEQMRALNMIEQGIMQVLATSTGEELSYNQVAEIQRILQPHKDASEPVTPEEERAVAEIAQRQRRAWGQR